MLMMATRADGKEPTVNRQRRTRRRAAGALAGAMVALWLAGCSSTVHPSASSTRTSSTSAASSAPSSSAAASSTTAATVSTRPVRCGRPDIPAASGPLASIGAIQFVSPTVGWAVGTTIWATADGGTTWRKQSPPAVNFSSIDALDANHAWVLGVQYPSVVVTSDGGQHWVSLPEPGAILDSVHFVTPTVGFAVAGGTATGARVPQCGGVLLRTNDGGRTWRQLASPPNVQSACFSDRSDGWLSASVGERADVFHSSNGGTSWQHVFSPPLTDTAQKQGSPAAATAQLQCAHGAVWALYLGLAGGVSNQFPWFAYHGLYPHPWQPVFMQGYTEDANLTIRTTAEAPGSYPGPFSAISSSSAIFVGSDIVANPPAANVALATDNGATLTSLGKVAGIVQPAGAAFVSSKVGWVVGEGTAQGCSDQAGPFCPWLIEATADGGHTWATQMSFTP